MNRQNLELVKVAVATTGSAGSATGSSDSIPVNGKLHAVYLDYHASAPGGTTDVTISLKSDPGATLLTVTDNATDGWYFPRQQVCDESGTGLTYDGTRKVSEPYPVADALTVAVAQSDALTDCVVAYLWIEVG